MVRASRGAARYRVHAPCRKAVGGFRSQTRDVRLRTSVPRVDVGADGPEPAVSDATPWDSGDANRVRGPRANWRRGPRGGPHPHHDAYRVAARGKKIASRCYLIVMLAGHARTISPGRRMPRGTLPGTLVAMRNVLIFLTLAFV